ncbi:MAG: bifunctional 4-hydroxy-2-oxoglutarate aldolase/2-dehydro-3-deoxy-phosphogluconate aldolase [Treponema sp.]|nr:bifunctional 4-hydroxy-2-oxoglutarate aldolase/2-dehydro-3-deoxy-phosphogluconate aldolase [Treponema sp.]
MENNSTYFASLPSVIAVVSVPDPLLAVETAKALVDGGVRAVELALRNPSALESICKIREQVPEMIVGAGTVIKREQVRQVIDAGAVFAVSPGLNPRVAEEAVSRNIPFAPGIATPSDIEAALELGLEVMKVFPAHYLGGIPYMKSIYAPYAHLKIKFIPLGGLKEEDIISCLAEEMIISVGGSWIASRADIENRDWEKIRKKAASALALVKQAGGRI